MATLFNTKISQTYEGLLKTIDNAAITATLKELTDGSGNQSGLYLNTAGDFKVSAILEWGSLKDTGTGVTITRFVTSTDGIENFDNNTSLPTSAAVKLYVDTKFSQTDTLTEVLSFGNVTSGFDIAVSAGDDITFTDSSKALFGAASDLKIYHDGLNSYIKDDGTGGLYIEASTLEINGGSVSETFLLASLNGAVELFYDNTKRLETTTDGSKVTGNLVVTGTITGSGGSFLPLAGGTMTGNIVLNDNVKTIYGTANDGLELYHDGSNSYISDVGSGNLFIRASANAQIEGANGENMAIFKQDGAVELYHDNSKKLETTSTGVAITGGFTISDTSNANANIIFSDNSKAVFGAGDDLQIYHNGSNSIISDSGTGSLKIETSALLVRNPSDNSMIDAQSGGAVNLYYDGLLKIQTLTDGAKVTGNLEVTGTITGAGGSFLPLIGGTMTGDTIHNDNIKSIYGTASDGLEIYHSGTDSFIKDIGTGNLRIRSTSLRLEGTNASNMIVANESGNVNLYYNGSQKIATTNTGISVTGNGAFTGSVTIPDNTEFQAGTSADLLIGHNATDSYVRNTTGALLIDQAAVTQSIVFRVSNANALDTTALTISRNGDLTTGRDVTIAGDLTVNGTTTTVNSQTLAVVDPLIQLAKDNTANSLDIGLYGDYNDGTGRYLGLFSDASDGNKFKLFKGTTVEPTTTVNIGGAGYVAADLQVAGLEIASGTSSGNFTFGAGNELRFGSGNEFGFFYSSGVSNIRVNSGLLDIRADNLKLCNQDKSENYLTGINNGAVTLNYAGSEKLATTSTGVSVTGGGIFTGNTGIFGAGSTSTPSSKLSIGGNAITTLKPTVVIADTTNGASLTLRGQSPVLFFDGTAAGVPKILMDGQGIEFKDGTLDSEGSVHLKIDSSGNSTFAGNVTASRGFFNAGATNVVATFTSTDATSTLQCIDGVGNVEFGASGNDFVVQPAGGVAQLTVGSSTSTFTGNVKVNGGNVTIKKAVASNETMLGLEQSGAGTSTLGSITYDQSDDAMRLLNNSDFGGTSLILGTRGQDIFKIDYSGNSTFAGNVTVSGNAVNSDVKITSAALALLQLEDTGLSKTYNIELGRSSTAGDLTFRSISGEKVRFTEAGKVGIGTDSPSSKLDVQQATAGNIISAEFDNTDYTANNRNAIKIRQQISSSGSFSAYLGSDKNTGNLFLANDSITSNHLVINTSGNVGIGTDSPSATLEVSASATTGVDIAHFSNSNGTVKIKHALDGLGSGIVSIFDASNNEDVRFSAQGNSWFNAGNIGIGTTAPAANLHVKEQSGSQSEIKMSAASNEANYGYLTMTDNTINTAKLTFGTTYGYNTKVDAMTIFNGNVGIGTASPSEKLEVDGNVQIGSTTDAKLYMVSTGGNGNNERFFIEGYAYGGTYGGGFKLSTRNSSNVFNTAVTVDGIGNVGIGTVTPQKPLHIEGVAGSQMLVTSADDTIGTTAGILLRAESGEADSSLRAKGGVFFERQAANGLGDLILAVNSADNNDAVTKTDACITVNQLKQVEINKHSNTAPTLFGENYPQTATLGTNTSVVDTGIIPEQGVYEFHVMGNPNAQGSGAYMSIVSGLITIACDYTQALSVFLRIESVVLAEQGGGSSNIQLTVGAFMQGNGSAGTTKPISEKDTSQIRLLIGNYSGTIGSNQVCRIIRKL